MNTYETDMNDCTRTQMSTGDMTENRETSVNTSHK